MSLSQSTSIDLIQKQTEKALLKTGLLNIFNTPHTLKRVFIPRAD